ncbi:hypothetical protein TWF694_000369 [Orbilia ellipsospora]|uniref:Uncharacterized protein n=1 Tax=Orbilia ellipsospora TaxID=2528407 RepID=A0AAV9XPS3_9PEZI
MLSNKWLILMVIQACLAVAAPVDLQLKVIHRDEGVPPPPTPVNPDEKPQPAAAEPIQPDAIKAMFALLASKSGVGNLAEPLKVT